VSVCIAEESVVVVASGAVVSVVVSVVTVVESVVVVSSCLSFPQEERATVTIATASKDLRVFIWFLVK
jgi:hypothetical protein